MSPEEMLESLDRAYVDALATHVAESSSATSPSPSPSASPGAKTGATATLKITPRTMVHNHLGAIYMGAICEPAHKAEAEMVVAE